MNFFLLLKHFSFSFLGASGTLFALPVFSPRLYPDELIFLQGGVSSHVFQEALLSLHPDSREIRDWQAPLSDLLTLRDALIEMSVSSIRDCVIARGAWQLAQ